MATPDLCGNGSLDEGEDCEGDDLAGATCESLGMGPGSVTCNDFCSYVVAGCAFPENCSNAKDDDGEGIGGINGINHMLALVASYLKPTYAMRAPRGAKGVPMTQRSSSLTG